MFRKLDFLNESPPFYIFSEKSNKTSFGGVIFIFFIIIMILISLLYFYDYLKNEKYEIEYSRFYSPIKTEQIRLKNEDPLLNPTLNFTMNAKRYINRSYNNSEFAFYVPSKGFIYNVESISLLKNVSSFKLELVYRCQNIEDRICPLREKDQSITSYGDYYLFDFIYPSFILDHSKSGDPFIREDLISFRKIYFNFNNPMKYSLNWKVIKYKDQEGFFDIIKGKKKEYIFGYLDEEQSTSIPNEFEYSLSFKYKVIGRIELNNFHYDFDQYKRKQISFLTILANIGALFSTFKGILVTAFKFYSNSFDNHKMIKIILSKKLKKYSSNDDNDNNENNKNKNKNKIYQLMPINDINDDNDNDNTINNNDDNLLIKNLISNKNDEINDNEIINLKKISFIQYLLNNIYCKKLEFNVQERIETCNKIVKTYMSYEKILYNQMIFENLLSDYNWNNPKLKYFNNNQLINRLKNLEEGINVENMDKEEKKDSIKFKKPIRWTIIIPIIVLLTIVMIIAIIIVLAIPDDQCIIGKGSKCLTCKGKVCGSCNRGYKLVAGKCIEEDSCEKGEENKCLTCKGKECGSCNNGYKLEDGKCFEEDNCIIGEEDKCLTCKGKKCGSCNEGYILIDGSCLLNFSFKAIYETKYENENVTLIYDSYKNYITRIEIDKEEISKLSNTYTFNKIGEHIVYILLDTQNLKYLNLFIGIDNLKSIYFLKRFNTRNILSLEALFYDCSSLEFVDMSNLNFEKVENMDEMFYFCESLKAIKFPNSTTPNLRYMSKMFCGCRNLTSIDLTYLNTENVGYMPFLFYDCVSLTSINLTNFNTKNLVSMPGFLANCESLTSIDMSNFITDKVEYMFNLFQNCYLLKSIDLSNFNTKRVSSMVGLFYGCYSLEYVNLSQFNTSKVTDLTAFFYGCESLTSVNISHFDTSNVKNMSLMFVSCRSLKSLNVSNFDTSKVTLMYGMFAGCSNLTSLNINNFNTENVIDIDYFLEECTSLTSIDLSSFKTEKMPNMTEVFTNCINLAYIDISNFSDSTYYFNLFRGLPESGIIKINSKIKGMINISDSWTIINVDE